MVNKETRWFLVAIATLALLAGFVATTSAAAFPPWNCFMVHTGGYGDWSATHHGGDRWTIHTPEGGFTRSLGDAFVTEGGVYRLQYNVGGYQRSLPRNPYGYWGETRSDEYDYTFVIDGVVVCYEGEAATYPVNPYYQTWGW